MFSRLLVVVLACLGHIMAYGVPDSPLFLFLRQLPENLPYGKCRIAFANYVHSLKHGHDWALHMYDSSTKYPDGILATNGYSLGHFDQCLQTVTREFSGKFCLINARYSFINSTYPVFPVSRFKFNRNEANLAICIPSVCNAKLIETALQESIYMFPILRNLHIHAKINDEHCSILSKNEETNGSDNIWLCGCVLIAALVYLARMNGFWSCFSIKRHWQRLFIRNPEAISCIHGLRVVALSIVIIGHRAESIASGPLLNPESIEKLFETGFNVIILNGTIFVDTFFTISGFLLCWNILKYDCDLKLKWWKIIWQRYLRLVPCYAIVIAVQALMMENTSSGPLWKLKIGKEASNCRKNWWANLLFINNYWDPQHICVDPSWYLACDMQFLLLGTLVILPMTRWTRYKMAPLAIASIFAFIVPFCVTYFNNLDPTVIPDPSTVGKTAENATNLLLYITAYCRAGPYLIGVATAYFWHQFQQSHKHVNEAFWSMGWYITAFCIFGSIILGWPFFTTTKIHPILTALYAASFRSVYSIGIAFIIIYGIYHKEVPFLSAEPFSLLSRVSYSVYLIHTLWIQLSYSWIRSPIHSTDLYQAHLILSDLIICTFLGIIFHVLIEGPISDIFYKQRRKNVN